MFGNLQIFRGALRVVKPLKTIRLRSTNVNENTSLNPSSIPKINFDEYFIITRIMHMEKQEVLDLFVDNFLKKEPCIVGAGIANKRNIFLEQKLLDALSQGISLKCQCRKTGSIVGACINQTICPWDCETMEQCAENCKCDKLKNLLKFYAFVTRGPNLWLKCHENKVYELAYLTTDSKNEGRGIGLNLIKKSIDLGKDLGYNVIRCDATNHYTSKLCEKAGMKMVWEFPYKNFVGSDDLPVLSPPPPHESCKVYVNFPHSPLK